MIADMLASNRQYASLPNFTAADCLRILAIGRNQFIDLFNIYRNYLGSRDDSSSEDEGRSIIDNILPNEPADSVTFKDWYTIHVGSVSVDDISKSTTDERRLIDQLVDQKDAKDGRKEITVANVDPVVLRSLFNRDLIYIEVPVSASDRISITTLHSFVMNRLSSDTREDLLYKIFIAIDQDTSLDELSDCLKIEPFLVLQAVSILCLLDLAFKNTIDLTTTYGEAGLEACQNSQLNTLSIPHDFDSTSNTSSQSRQGKKLAVIFDSTITAYLMMSNLSVGLKPHAVTMYEVGKLSDASLNAFLAELDKLAGSEEAKGEAQHYYDRVMNLRHLLHFLSDQIDRPEVELGGIDLLRGSSLVNLNADVCQRIVNKNYNMLVSINPLTYEDRQASSIDWPTHIGPAVPEVNSPWFHFFVAHLASTRPLLDLGSTKAGYVPPAVMLVRGSRFHFMPRCLMFASHFTVTSWGHDPVDVGAADLMSTVNDALLSDSVLIQVSNLCLSDVKLRQAYLPLPLDSDVSSSNAPDFIRNISSQLDLTALVGYIGLLVPTRTTPSSSSNPDHLIAQMDDLSDSVAFTGLHLGLPIFNRPLLEAVTESSNLTNLLEASNRTRIDAANRQMVKQMTQFIADQCGALTDMSSIAASNDAGQWPLPRKSLLCYRGSLFDLDVDDQAV